MFSTDHSVCEWARYVWQQDDFFSVSELPGLSNNASSTSFFTAVFCANRLLPATFQSPTATVIITVLQVIDYSRNCN